MSSKNNLQKIVLVFGVVANGLNGFVILQVPSLPNLVEIQTSLIGMGRALLLCRFRVLATCVDSKEGEWSLDADNLKAFVGSRLMRNVHDINRMVQNRITGVAKRSTTCSQ